MKRLLFGFVLFSICVLKSDSQTFPYWDTSGPILNDGGYGTYGGPFLATTNAIFGFHYGSYATSVARWTECGGWEDIPGLMVHGWPGTVGLVHGPVAMAVHNDYLYIVGFFGLDSFAGPINYADLDYELKLAPYTNSLQIVKFNLQSGVWTSLGQNFAATNVLSPSTIAIDSSNRIYVGFTIGQPDPGEGPPISLDGKTLDMLNVSTNDGASWQTVGGGLVAAPSAITGKTSASVTALFADGTNIYIGGDFSGPVGLSSPFITVWAGNSWGAVAGIDSGSVDNLGSSGWGVHVVNSVICIGTNIYVAGGFDSPQQGIARFSKVNGQSYPVGDPSIYLDWNTGIYGTYGMELTVNNGCLYLGGLDAWSDDGYARAAKLANPETSYPTAWDGLSRGSVDTESIPGVTWLAAATNGNAVFVYGGVEGGGSGGFSRWLVGSDGPSSSAGITDLSGGDGDYSLTIAGTPGSHWQVMASTDATDWSVVGAVTLWDGTGTFVDTQSYDSQPYYQLTNNCSQSAIYGCSETYTLCVTNDSADDLYFAVWDTYSGDTYVSDTIPVNSSNCYSFDPRGKALRFYFWEDNSGGDESIWPSPTLQYGSIDVTGDDKEMDQPIYFESGVPLCP